MFKFILLSSPIVTFVMNDYGPHKRRICVALDRTLSLSPLAFASLSARVGDIMPFTHISLQPNCRFDYSARQQKGDKKVYSQPSARGEGWRGVYAKYCLNITCDLVPTFIRERNNMFRYTHGNLIMFRLAF